MNDISLVEKYGGSACKMSQPYIFKSINPIKKDKKSDRINVKVLLKVK